MNVNASGARPRFGLDNYWPRRLTVARASLTVNELGVRTREMDNSNEIVVVISVVVVVIITSSTTIITISVAALVVVLPACRPEKRTRLLYLFSLPPRFPLLCRVKSADSSALLLQASLTSG